VLPPDAVLMPGKSIGSTGQRERRNWYLISRASAVTGRDLRTAEPTRDENGQPAVRFILTGDGGRKFYSFTSAHVGDNLAVVLDNKVQEVAVIKEAIHDTGIINGRFTDQQVQDLSMTLRSGALPAGIKYLEERTVGPSLGADSIRSGVRAAVVGHDRGAGVHADLLPLGGRERGYRTDFEPDYFAWIHGLLRSGAYAAGNCGCDSDGRHGRGFERADF
jgi:preprotein translocase subunit SecD